MKDLTKTMNNTLWKKIQDFDLDQPLSEYGFSTRLASENSWPEYFTQKAILEYKKFMYLAATADVMVAPSAIVDIVWHQHLIFTTSYNAFCEVLGKKIEHIPSTHNRQEYEKFKLAAERTHTLYEAAFGKQPAEVWQHTTIYEPLPLPKWKVDIRVFIAVGILAFIGILIPAYNLLYGLYITINNPYFIIGYSLLALIAFAGLEWYNKRRLVALTNSWDKTAFVFDLSPLELVYLQKGQLEEVIHGYVNQLVEKKRLHIHSNYILPVKKPMPYETAAEYTIIETVKGRRKESYASIVKELKGKPVFSNTEKAMDGLKKHVKQSAYFGRLFAFNFIVLSLLLVLGSIRFATGLVRDKPVGILFIVLLLLLAATIYFLYRLLNLFSTTIIPQLYKDKLSAASTPTGNWEWNYFLSGNNIFATAFLLVVADTGKHKNADTGEVYTSCSSGGGGGSCVSCGGCGGSS